jgi:hypothetical protein
MSIETMTWAKRQVCGCTSVKAVLMELANWARADGICEFRRVGDIAVAVETSDRTVQRALNYLEAPKNEGGLGLIRRLRRRRKDGGQQANCFELVGYIYGGDIMAPPGDKLSPRGCHGVGGGGDTHVTPYIEIDKEKKESPHSPPRARSANAAIPGDWKPLAIGDLPEAARTQAIQWPGGAYAAQAEAFHQYWLGKGARRANWDALWAARIQTIHSTVMPASHRGAGIFARQGALSVGQSCASQLSSVASQQAEDGRSARLRALLRPQVPEPIWARYFAPAAFLFDDDGLKVIAPTPATCAWIESNYARAIRTLADQIVPGDPWVRFDVAAITPTRTDQVIGKDN